MSDLQWIHKQILENYIQIPFFLLVSTIWNSTLKTKTVHRKSPTKI